jgi:3'-phosphoadenosine 5'-phosphosulfate sulfotransferase (PAPS reductase)/FAD synthetase
MSENSRDRGELRSQGVRAEGADGTVTGASLGEWLRLLPAEDPDALVSHARAEHSPVASFCLFSGGGDSAVLSHRCRDHYEALVFIDTGTAVPGVREHVERFAVWLDKPLKVYDSGDEFRRMVLGEGEDRRSENWRPLGFPGPGQHGRAYNRLKERQIERCLRDTKTGHLRSARVMFLTGVRRAESARRSKRAPLTRKGSAVFVNPLIDWTDAQMRAYRREHALPESDVAALIHRSGECNCGSFAAPGEREMLRSLWPDWFERTVASLEREAEAAGIPACRWGERPPSTPIGDVGPMCSSCEWQLFPSEAAA